MTLTLPRILLRPLIACVAGLAAALALWWLAAATHHARQTSLVALRATLRQLDAQLAHAREEAAQRAHLDQRLTNLLATHTTRDAAPWSQPGHPFDAHRVANLRVRAHAQASPLPHANALPTVNFQRLQIDAELLHELVLPELVAAWTQTAGAHVVPRGCALHRAPPSAALPLAAQCEFDWLSFTPPEVAP
ncbi:hypothetical protein AGMMS50225_18960 [Betaproteobacteria bacterium]|nr:hypothetical protein AGMMS50225_18960 [Betaproteobacteria bacterium]